MIKNLKLKKIMANKGEWSEFYALIKILADWKLYGADENLKRLESILYPILKVINQKNTKNEIQYELESDQDSIRIYSPEDHITSIISRNHLKKQVPNLLKAIQDAKGSSFSIEFADKIINDTRSIKIKSGSSHKADLFLVVHDIKIGHVPEVGFSIKSQVGGPSTLLNASGSTNFTYQILGNLIEADDINAIVGRSKIRDRIKKIYDLGGTLKYVSMDSEVFEANLKKIDTAMPDIISEILKIYYLGQASKLSLIATLLENENILTIPLKSKIDFYKYKIENFLEKIALGMVPNSAWDGKHQVHGGYIIIREDGELICYHVYNLDQFREYLLKNTKLDTPSSSRHKFGSVYKKDNRLFIKLNFQIRFIS